MNINYSKKGRNLIVGINGDIDHHTAEEIRDKVDKEFLRVNARNIIFDFTGVTFMDSSGIGMIIGRYKNIQKQGGLVVVANVHDDMNRIFEVSGLHKIIKCYDSVDAALNSQL